MWRGPALSTLLLWLLLLSALHISADEDAFEIPETPQQQTQQWYSGLQLGLPFNPGLGSTADHFCDSQLVVLGVHGARTSIVTRLLTLLGYYAGDAVNLIVNKNNTGMLKHWELAHMMNANDDFLKATSHPNFTHWTGIGYSGSYQTKAKQEFVWKFRHVVLPVLNRHCPWVLKDPRLCLTGDLLLRELQSPVCVLAWRHPTQVIQSLAHFSGKSGDVGMDEVRWSHLVYDMWISALRACRGYPTVLLPSDLTSPATVDVFLHMALDQLRAARQVHVQATEQGHGGSQWSRGGSHGRATSQRAEGFSRKNDDTEASRHQDDQVGGTQIQMQQDFYAAHASDASRGSTDSTGAVVEQHDDDGAKTTPQPSEGATLQQQPSADTAQQQHPIEDAVQLRSSLFARPAHKHSSPGLTHQNDDDSRDDPHDSMPAVQLVHRRRVLSTTTGLFAWLKSSKFSKNKKKNTASTRRRRTRSSHPAEAPAPSSSARAATPEILAGMEPLHDDLSVVPAASLWQPTMPSYGVVWRHYLRYYGESTHSQNMTQHEKETVQSCKMGATIMPVKSWPSSSTLEAGWRDEGELLPSISWNTTVPLLHLLDPFAPGTDVHAAVTATWPQGCALNRLEDKRLLVDLQLLVVAFETVLQELVQGPASPKDSTRIASHILTLHAELRDRWEQEGF